MTNMLNQSPHVVTGVSLGLPAVETPSQPVTFLVHWLELSIWPQEGTIQDNVSRVMYAVNSCLFGHDQQDAESLWQRFNWGGNAYRQHAETAHGIRLYWGNCNRDDHLHLQIPGQALEEIPFYQLHKLAKDIAALSLDLRCTRLDLAWDYCPFTTEQVRQSALCGNLRAKAKKVKRILSQTLVGKDDPDDPDGETVRIGQRSSQRFLRIYDKRGYVRTELELKAERANYAFYHIFLPSTPEPAPPLLAMGLLRDFVNFIDRSSDKNISRCALLPWWEKFVQSVAVMRQVIKREAKSLQRSMKWLQKSVFPTWDTVMECLGDAGKEWFMAAVSMAPTKRKPHHLRMLAETLVGIQERPFMAGRSEPWPCK